MQFAHIQSLHPVPKPPRLLLVCAQLCEHSAAATGDAGAILAGLFPAFSAVEARAIASGLAAILEEDPDYDGSHIDPTRAAMRMHSSRMALRVMGIALEDKVKEALGSSVGATSVGMVTSLATSRCLSKLKPRLDELCAARNATILEFGVLGYVNFAEKILLSEG
eukprot:6183335-Pleurochrysis_carterae.AAC.1